MRRFLTDNLGWKLLSVVSAFLLWVAIAREPELTTSISAPVLFKNIPDDLDISSDVPERVHLEVRGPSRRLTAESLAQIAVVLDLSALAPGERTFTIDQWNIRQLPIGVTFYRAVPSEVALHFERLLAKEVPIEPAWASAAPDGYMVSDYSFNPPKARIRGPEARVRNIDHVKTDPIDLSGTVGLTSKRVLVRVGDPQIRLESSPQVQVTLRLAKIQAKESQ